MSDMKDPLEKDAPASDAPKKGKHVPLHEMEEMPKPLRGVFGALDRFAHGPARKRMNASKHYVGLNDRLFANIIDLFLVFVIFTPLFGILNSYLYHGMDPEIAFSEAVRIGKVDEQAGTEYLKSTKVLEQMLKVYAVQGLILGAIYVFFWVKFQATPGKMILGYKVVEKGTEEPIGLETGILRYLGFYLAGIPLMIGFIWMVFHPKKQGWHDMFAGTVVVRTDRSYRKIAGDCWRWIKSKLSK